MKLFSPDRLTAREGQIKEIAKCLGPAKTGKSIRNLFIFGSPGVGKTSVCRWILKEHFASCSAFVNCWSKRTTHKVLEEVLLQSGMVVHGRESTSELVKKFEKSGKRPIVCLDECDQLKDKDILYVLLRNSCGIILISNDAFALADLDNRIKSSLFLNEIEFRHYSRDEVLAILKERVSYGFRDDAISPILLSAVAGLSNGDARVGLQTLKVAAKEAESKGLDSVTMDEVKSAIKSARKYRLSYLLGKLNPHQKTIYEILKEKRSMDSGKLFDAYCQATKDPVVDRAYRNHMERMEELGLVKSEGSGRWKKYEIMG